SVPGPGPDGLVDAVLETPRAGVDANDLRSYQAHARHVWRLALHIHDAHVDPARKAQSSGRRRRSHTVLPRAGLRDHAGFSHSPSQKNLPEGVVELVRSRVKEVLA